MHAFFVLIFACLAVAAYGYPNIHIVGGSEAPPGKFPYQVSLRKNERHFCGGSIINQYTILTAAHCITGFRTSNALRSLTVHAGTNLLNESGSVYIVKQAIPHSNFDFIESSNDIGVLILTTPIEYTQYIQPIPLATSDVAPEGTSCTLSGWGRTSFNGRNPNNLQEIELSVHSQAKCRQAWLRNMNVLSSHICTLTRAGEGACHGDSGGPLVARGVQIGVVSFGIPCARGSPDVFTRVSSFTTWIRRNSVE
ncbi:chymotrypsin-1-like [Temnothorax americanus]|uniref:chymotrypsin-1-like n=1 Tax=Temnothorax americanus TaxID=1964332 RepID=UPI004067E565